MHNSLLRWQSKWEYVGASWLNVTMKHQANQKKWGSQYYRIFYKAIRAMCLIDTNRHDNIITNSAMLIDIRYSNPIKDFCKSHRLASEIRTIRGSPNLKQHDWDVHYDGIICKRTSWGILPWGDFVFALLIFQILEEYRYCWPRSLPVVGIPFNHCKGAMIGYIVSPQEKRLAQTNSVYFR